MNLKIRKNDNVVVITGKDKGKVGKVIAVLPKDGKVIVEGVNIVKKHQKPSKKYPQGGIIDKNMPMQSGNIMIICKSCNKPTRLGFKNSGKDKRRICKQCGEVVDAA